MGIYAKDFGDGMACSKAPSMTFAVYELYPDGKECNEFKTFSISKDENDAAMKKIGYAPSADIIDDYGILITLFHKLYNFTIGPNGFRIIWDEDEANGELKQCESGKLYWIGPRPPAVPIGGNWWKIRRIV